MGNVLHPVSAPTVHPASTQHMSIGRCPSLVVRDTDDDGLQRLAYLVENEDPTELVLRFERHHPLSPAEQASGITSKHAESYILTARALGINRLYSEEHGAAAARKRFLIPAPEFASFGLMSKTIDRIQTNWSPDFWFRLRHLGVYLPVLSPQKNIYEKLAVVAQHLQLSDFATLFKDAWPALISGRRYEHQRNRAIQFEDLRLFYIRHIQRPL
jgi:hypothetical protein